MVPITIENAVINQESCGVYKKGLKLCDKALKKTRKALSASESLADRQLRIIDTQTAELVDLKQSEDAWYNSKTLWLGLGIFIGGAAVYKLRK